MLTDSCFSFKYVRNRMQKFCAYNTKRSFHVLFTRLSVFLKFLVLLNVTMFSLIFLKPLMKIENRDTTRVIKTDKYRYNKSQVLACLPYIT